MKKKQINNIINGLIWANLLLIPFIIVILQYYNNVEITLAQSINNTIGWIANNNIIYNALNSIFTNSSNLFSGIELNTTWIMIFAYIITISFVKILVSAFMSFTETLTNLVDKLSGVGTNEK